MHSSAPRSPVCSAAVDLTFVLAVTRCYSSASTGSVFTATSGNGLSWKFRLITISNFSAEFLMGVFSNFYNNFYQYLGRRIGHNSFNLFIMQLGTRYLTVLNDHKKY